MLSRLLASSTALAVATGFTAGMAQADYTLHVIHINDLHSRIEPINRYDSTCGAEDDAEDLVVVVGLGRDELSAGLGVLVRGALDGVLVHHLDCDAEREGERETLHRI